MKTISPPAGMDWVLQRRASHSMWSCTAQASSNPGLLQVTAQYRGSAYCSQRAELKSPLSSQNAAETHTVPLSSLSGVTLSEEEADNNQGNRFCLVAIGRLQVLFPFHFISHSRESDLCHIQRNSLHNSVVICSCYLISF